MKTRFAHASRTTSPALREGQDKRALPSPLPLGEGQGEGALPSPLPPGEGQGEGALPSPLPPGEGQGEGALPSPLPPGEGQGEGAPRAFTLVELLVVIGIIGLLAAIITPVVMQSLTKARNAAIKAEIDMLHMAIMNYKNEYGSFPPAYVPVIDLAAGSDAASKHLRRIYPRLSPAASGTQASCLPYLNVSSGTFQQATAVTPDTAIVAWLYGYTDDVQAPVLSTTGTISISGGFVTFTGTAASRKKMFDFDSSRISNFKYAPAGKPTSSFVYINSANYVIGGAVGTFGPYYAHRVPISPSGDFVTLSQPAFNPDSFQILCAGRDEQFGNDDDLSNFWPGTRREYLDSLKD